MPEEGRLTAECSETTRLKEELDLLYRKLADEHKMASLGRLLAGIAHEISTPIGSILSNNEVSLKSLEGLQKLLAAAQASSSPPLEKAMDIRDTLAGLAAVDKIACERISAVVRSLRTFARVDQGDFRKVQIQDVIENTLKLAATVCGRRIAVEKDFGELPEVECYPQALSQVLLNLLVNACQAIDGEGKVTLRTRIEGDCVHIAIADTGRGILPEHCSRIFQPGFTTKPAGEGTGLGLAISRNIIVNDHHGSIDFESRPGGGTIFHVRIPIHQPTQHEIELATGGSDRR